MKNEYILKSGRKVVVTAKNKRVAKKFQGKNHYAYTILIEAEGTDYVFKTTFHDSIHNYESGQGLKKKTIDEALNCVLLDYDSYDYNPDKEDFISEFGYENDRTLGDKVYNACWATYNALNLMFSREELNELTEMVG